MWTYNEQTGKNELKPVNHVFVNQDPEITYLTLENGDGSSEPIITTPEHPFYVKEAAKNTPSSGPPREVRSGPEGAVQTKTAQLGQDSTGYGPKLSSTNSHGDLGPNWVGAGHLKLGDQIRKFDGSSGTVVNVTTVAETRTMYNLDVVGNDNFFVGEKGWLVHNAGEGCKIGFAPSGAVDAITGMNKGGDHAIRHLRDEAGLIPNKGSLQSQVDFFSNKIAIPILENPAHTFNWRVGVTNSKGFVGEFNGQTVVVFIAKDGPYAGKVISSLIPDANQVVQWGIK